MGEAKDWRNLPGFLEGLKTAGRKLKSRQVEKMVRRANAAGRQGVVLEVLRRGEGTGVRLQEVGFVREVMLGAVMRAIAGNWELEAVKEGEKYSRAYWELLWDEKHRVVRSAEEDPKRRAEVVGVVVEMVAAGIMKGEGGEGKVQDMRGLVERLLGCWQWVELGLDKENWDDANYKLLMWAPVWHGMVLARQVLGGESQIGKELGEKAEKVESMLEQAKDIVAAITPEGGKRRGLQMYKQLTDAVVL